MIDRIDHFVLTVADLGATLEFYERVLGFTPKLVRQRRKRTSAQLAGFGFANLRRLGAARRGPEYPVTSPNRRRSSQSVRASAIS